jgi:dienelactone hydrolase
MAEIRTDWITLQVADVTSVRAYVGKPQDGHPRAGLLVFQEAFGVKPHIRDVAERFAPEGFHTLSPELFHRTAPGETSEAGFPTPKSVITSLAGFGIALRPQPPGGRIAIPAPFR